MTPDTSALARAICEAINSLDLLCLDDTACTSLEALDKALADAGDPLSRFAVREIIEGATDAEGLIDLNRAVHVLNRAVDDLTALRDAVQNLQEKV